MVRKPDPYMIDQDHPELTDEELKSLRPAREVLPPELYENLAKNKGGRPKLAAPKVSVTLRLDPDIVSAFKATGPGWQTKMNDALRRAKPKPAGETSKRA